MAKKRGDANKRQIKLILSPEDHDRVRLAAALTRQTMAEYCRAVVLQDVEKLTRDIKLPGKIETKKGKK